MPTALVAMANFKGTLTNTEATSIAAHALHDLGYTPVQLPIGDGGQGTALCVFTKLGGEFKKVGISNVLFFPNAQNPEWAYIESTETCGRKVVLANGENALTASSYRLGECLNEIFHSEYPALKKIYIGLGDSGISDVGVGMLQKLGFRFLDSAQNELLPLISEMPRLASVHPPPHSPWEKYQISVLCDVKNPLCGPNGSARVFSPQKGASPEQVALIETGMEKIAAAFQSRFQKIVADTPYCGSVGGLSSAFYACLNAQLVPGAKFLFDWIGLNEMLDSVDLIVTGEGRTDEQTLSGKAPFELLQRASQIDSPIYFFSGSLGTGYEKLLENECLSGVYASGIEPNASVALYDKIKSVFGTA